MKLETIYNALVEYSKEQDFAKLQDLMSRIEKAVRTENSYKTTSKTRVNAIKRVASKDNVRPVLTGYGIKGDYKFVTDSYHLIAIKQDIMPLPLVATSDELKRLGIDKNEYMQKNGRESLIYGVYPNLEHFLEFDKSQELPMVDMDDLTSFIKLHKKDEELYEINGCTFNPQFLKNIIDVLGAENTKIYFQGKNKPLYFENDKDEIGLVLPCIKY